MLREKETGTDVIRRWKAGRVAFHKEMGFGSGTFDEDLRLFERQVRDEAGERSRRPSGTDPLSGS